MTQPPRFRAIAGGLEEAQAQPKRRGKRRAWAGCGTCLSVTGTASRVLIAVVLSPDEDEQGRLVSGQKGRACLMCATRGQLTLFS